MKYEVCLSYTVSARTAAEATKKAIGHITVREKLIGIYSPTDVFGQMNDERRSAKEHFVAFHMNTQNEIIKKELISIGTLNMSVVHPREVFRSAITNGCASLIVAHNHPSGSLEPSDEDIAMTKRLRDAGRQIGIEILDHVIVTATGYKSLANENLL